MHNKINLKRYIVPILILFMFAGLLWSRAILSVSLILFLAYALLVHGREGLEEVRRSWWLKGMVALFLIPLVSGLWSDDTKEWWLVMQVKLPLLLFPFSVGALRGIGYSLFRLLMIGLIGMVVLSMCWSLWGYVGMDDAEYLKAKVMRVAMYDDHVRYAWLVVICYSLMLYDLLVKIPGYQIIKVSRYQDIKISGYQNFRILLLLFFAVFLHLLAAKTGLLGFYVVNIIFLFTIVRRKYTLPRLTDRSTTT